MSTHNGANPRQITRAEYDEGALSPLHPKCLAQSEIYIARLQTLESTYYAIEFAQVVMDVKAIEDGYLVTVANPRDIKRKSQPTWRFDPSGYRRGLANKPQTPLPDGYFVTGRDEWDDGLAILITKELTRNNSI